MIRLSTYIAHSASQGYALRFPSIGEGNYRPAYYANGTNFVHGGKGTFQNYNQDQKTAIQALPESADDNDYYLFFVDCYDRLDTAGQKSKEPVSGYMPVGRHYGFIYNEYNNIRAIAHEVGHGVNALHHTFSAESETFHATNGTTDNLMDYSGGIVLNHNQWQWSHETHRNVLGFLDEEEESESQIGDDYICTMKFVNEFCYALTNGTWLLYEADGLPRLGHSCDVFDNILGTTNINICVTQDVDIEPKSMQLSDYSNYFELTCSKYPTATQTIFKNLIDDYEAREKRYLDFLADVNLEKESMYKWLSVLPEKAYAKIDISTRKTLLSRLSDAALHADYCSCQNEETIAINLIKYTPKSDLQQLLDYLLYSDVYENLAYHIDGDNYMKFMGELTNKWALANIDKVREASTDYNKAAWLFYWNRVNSTMPGNSYITYKTDYERGRIDVEFWAGDWVDTWFRSDKVHNKTFDAQDIILLQCKTVPECFFKNAQKNQIIIMPAFLFEAMCSKFDFDKKVDYFETGLTIASFAVGIGELGAVVKTWEGASWARKGWIIWNYVSSAADLALSNKELDKFFEEKLPELHSYWAIISPTSSVYDSATNFDLSILLKLHNAFDAFCIGWNAYKTGKGFSETFLDQEEVDFINAVDKYIQQIKDNLE